MRKGRNLYEEQEKSLSDERESLRCSSNGADDEYRAVPDPDDAVDHCTSLRGEFRTDCGGWPDIRRTDGSAFTVSSVVRRMGENGDQLFPPDHGLLYVHFSYHGAEICEAVL